MPKKEEDKKESKNTVAIKIALVTCLIDSYKTYLLGQWIHSALYSLFLLDHLLNLY